MIVKENGKLNLNGWSMRCKYIPEETTEDELEKEAESCTFIVHLPTKSAT